MADSLINKQLQLNLHYVIQNSYKSLRLENFTPKRWIITHIVQGEVETVTGNQRYVARSGDVTIHPANVCFSKYDHGPGQREYFVFEANFWPNLELFRFYPVPPVISLLEPAEFSAIFQELYQTWQNEKPLRNLQLFSLTLQLFELVLESWLQGNGVECAEPLAPSPDRFMAVVNFMAENLAQKVSRTELADLVHLHPRYFDRLFCKTFGMAPTEMLREMRLDKAKHLLETSNKPLAEIANACGFKEATYFNRVFQHHYGQTPGQYRRNFISLVQKGTLHLG